MKLYTCFIFCFLPKDKILLYINTGCRQMRDILVNVCIYLYPIIHKTSIGNRMYSLYIPLSTIRREPDHTKHNVEKSAGHPG